MNTSPDLAKFIEVIATNPDLESALVREQSTETFATACVHLAEKCGLHFSAEEVCELLRARTLTWQQRHIL